MPDAPVVGVFAGTFGEATLVHAVLELGKVDLEVLARNRVAILRAALLLDELLQMAVQPLAVNRIDGVLHALQPIASRSAPSGDHPDYTLADESVPTRQQRRRLSWTHVGEEHPAEFLDRIGRCGDLVLEIRTVGFVGLLEAAPGAVELPAVIRAADPIFGRDPVCQRRAAMRTGLGDESKFPTTVFEEHEVFAEQAHALGPALIHLFRCRDRVPIAALEVAHRRTRTDAGEDFVLFGR